MFSKAYEIISKFMYPVIVSTKHHNKDVKCGCGAFIILNDEGWILSVAHILGQNAVFEKHKKELKKYNNLVSKSSRKRARQPKGNPEWIEDISYWWGKDGVELKDIKVIPEGDILLARLDPYDKSMVKVYPIIKNPNKNIKLGTSLCKFGYPFHKITATYDKKKKMFILPPETFPMPRFPIEGIYTRNATAGKSSDGKYEILYLETSSPGLRGQSGGPITDISGQVWSIQSRTRHLALGFNPKIKRDNKEIEENQFLNVGMGAHPKLIVNFLKDNGIRFNLSKE